MKLRPEPDKRLVSEKVPPSQATVEFSPHNNNLCQGGMGLADLQNYNIAIATYKGPCAGGCGVTRIVEVPMS